MVRLPVLGIFSGVTVQIVSGGASDVGLVRTNNEDAYRILDGLQLFVLSDGMGGEAHGEVAAAMAVDTVVQECREAKDDPNATDAGDSRSGWSKKTKLLSRAVHAANKAVFESAQKNPEQHGMGATVTAGWLEETKLSLAHVGDSRAYLLRGGVLQQLTNDHSLVAEQVRRGILTASEAEKSDLQSVLLRALGATAEVEVDTEEHVLFPRDVLVFCSDGLTRMVTEPEIAGALQAELDPTAAAKRLVALANENGGGDNVTVIVVRMEPETGGWLSRLLGGSRKHADGNGSAGGK